MPIVSAIAVSRVFHQGRDSVTSYAALSVVMIDTIAPELLQIVTRKAKVRMPPLFCLDSSCIASREDRRRRLPARSGAIIATTSSISPASGKKLATAMTKRSAGNRAKKK